MSGRKSTRQGYKMPFSESNTKDDCFHRLSSKVSLAGVPLKSSSPAVGNQRSWDVTGIPPPPPPPRLTNDPFPGIWSPPHYSPSYSPPRWSQKPRDPAADLSTAELRPRGPCGTVSPWLLCTSLPVGGNEPLPFQRHRPLTSTTSASTAFFPPTRIAGHGQPFQCMHSLLFFIWHQRKTGDAQTWIKFMFILYPV